MKDALRVHDNILNREFSAERPDQKWLTDVSEFKYSANGETRKLYLSAILDLYDRRIVAYRIDDRNDNPIVMNTFKEAFLKEPDAHPLCHSDRGFQYTGPQFYMLMQSHGCIHSMPRVAHCIDNGPMEGFWGILKREMYYGQKFDSRDSLVSSIKGYIEYYNGKRIQRKHLGSEDCGNPSCRCNVLHCRKICKANSHDKRQPCSAETCDAKKLQKCREESAAQTSED